MSADVRHLLGILAGLIIGGALRFVWTSTNEQSGCGGVILAFIGLTMALFTFPGFLASGGER